MFNLPSTIVLLISTLTIH